jgi:spermidine/putrescine transport system permease protein
VTVESNIVKKNLSFWALAFYTLLVYVFLFSPIAIVLLMSFNSARFGTFPLEHLTLDWHLEMFKDRTIWAAVQNSVTVAALTVILSVPLGTLAAFALSRFKFRLKPLFTSVLLVPLILPGVIMGVSLLSFYNFFNIRTSLFTVVLGHTALALPYATLVISARMQGFDLSLEEAAASLGAPYHRVFRKITLPLLAPGMIAAALFAWTISFDEFVITFFIGTGVQQTLPLKIWSLLRFGISPTINSISAVILCASMFLIVAAIVLSRRR